MTVTELRKFLEEEERNGHGDCKICVVSSDCEPISDYDCKFITNDIEPYYDRMDNTITITD